MPPFASGSAPREAASAWATRCEPIGVSTDSTFVYTAVAASTQACVRWSAT